MATPTSDTPGTGTEQPVTSIDLRLEAAELAALDAWIDRHADPKPSRSDAIRQVLAGALGGYGPSTTLPKLVTGRDIFDLAR